MILTTINNPLDKNKTMKNNRNPEKNKQGKRSDKDNKHTISVKYLDSLVPKYNEIIADSLEDAIEFAKKLDDNPDRDYVIFDKFQRIVVSKIRDKRKEYKHHKESHGHGNGHGKGHDDHDDMYA